MEKNKLANKQVEKWALELQEYGLQYLYKEGKSHTDADAVSRMPMPAEHSVDTGAPFCRHCSRPVDGGSAERPGFEAAIAGATGNALPMQAALPFLEKVVGIDVKGPFPLTKRGNRFVLVVMCALTRWPETFALPDSEVPGWMMAKILFEEIIYRYGFIEVLVSDRSTNFHSEIVRELLVLMRSRHHTTTGYHPQTNGIPERFNRSWAEGVGKQLDDEKRDWDLYLQRFNAAYRTASHSEMGLSPFELLFAHTPQSVLRVQPIAEGARAPPFCYDEYYGFIRQKRVEKINRALGFPAFSAKADGPFVVVGTPRNQPYVAVIRPIGGKKREVVSEDRLQLWEEGKKDKNGHELQGGGEEIPADTPRTESREREDDGEAEEDFAKEEREREEKQVPHSSDRPATFRIGDNPEMDELFDELGLGDELEVRPEERQRERGRRKAPQPVQILAGRLSEDGEEEYRVSFDDGTFAWMKESEVDTPELVGAYERAKEKFFRQVQ
uniref:Integrase catalytic domain-containing protein n=1 Tax=Chromera velia CCMP2878 TaxID=1169474 RepID=A0A0G4EZM5_9ALVE|eukprot:Cvel_14239.t1-p1 / transcript=Cvel_14239.t1 / gene=Cvel_14239 / organism=Chromera_velia_CCMP2878 / gene_product=Retrovirus-related Pol polyprotein from transposon, putative / transcript_product=Retrovirus-related Pol polyprotein from transposon, putative / location=Cvel_scaffold1005:11806-13815(-) / protein_length=496 / sequence_SO=supercontig / SO=protein_coding / is_pseudo=false